MSWNDYQAWAVGMASTETKRSSGSMLLAAALGLTGEGGEVADIVKKLLYHRSGNIEALTLEQYERLVLEAGDVLWYVALLCSGLGVTLEAAMLLNMEKLQARHSGREFDYGAYVGLMHREGIDVAVGVPSGSSRVNVGVTARERGQEGLERDRQSAEEADELREIARESELAAAERRKPTTKEFQDLRKWIDDREPPSR